jgi:KDO2-lipid IV(A) lauroyltransferase
MMTLWQGLCHLPTSWHPVMGKLFGKLLFLFAGSRKKIAQVNLALCFPKLPKTEQEKLLRDNFLYLGRSFIENWNSLGFGQIKKYKAKLIIN